MHPFSNYSIFFQTFCKQQKNIKVSIKVKINKQEIGSMTDPMILAVTLISPFQRVTNHTPNLLDTHKHFPNNDSPIMSLNTTKILYVIS